MDNIITYTKEIPFIKRFFGIAFLLLGIFMLFVTGSFFTIILMVIGFGINNAEGTDLNLSNKTMRPFQSYFGIKFGSWKPMPAFEYVSVFKTKENQTIRVVTAETTQTNDVILVNLFYNRNKHITCYKTTQKKKAFEIAEHFKLALDIDILDATTHEKKWL
jgi:hypothetical protein